MFFRFTTESMTNWLDSSSELENEIFYSLRYRLQIIKKKIKQKSSKNPTN